MNIAMTGRILALALLLAGVAGCGSREQRRAEHLALGQAHFQQGEYDKARVEMKNVLQIDPGDVEALCLLGQVEEGQRQWARAVGYYRKALELAPRHVPALERLGRIHLLARDFAGVEKTVAAIRKLQPDNLVADTLMAAVAAGRGDKAAALRGAEAVVARDASQSDAVGLLAALHLEAGHTQAARQALERGLARQPGAANLRLALADLLAGTGQLPAAEAQYRALVDSQPATWTYRQALVGFYGRSGQSEKAEAALRDAVRVAPGDPQPRLVLARFLAQTRGLAAAEAELKQAIAALADDLPAAQTLRFGLAGLYRQHQRDVQAEQVYREMIALEEKAGAGGSGANGLGARTQLAGLLHARGDAAGAAGLVDQVLALQAGNREARLLHGQLAQAAGDYPQAIADYRQLLKDAADVVEIYKLLADTHLLNGEKELAREVLQQGVEANPGRPAARLNLAAFQAKAGESEAALKSIAQVLQDEPGHAGALQALAEVQALRRDWPAAMAAAGRLKQAHPGAPVGYQVLAALYAAQERHGEAAAELEQALDKSPRSLSLLAAVTAQYLAQGRGDAALGRIGRFLVEVTGLPEARLLMAETLASLGRDQEAERDYLRLLTDHPDLAAAHIGLSRLKARGGDARQALAVLRLAQARLPGDAHVALALAEAYRAAGQDAQAGEQYQALLRAHPGHAVAANNLASLLADTRRDRPGLEQALGLVRGFAKSGNPFFLDTLGWVHHRLNQPDQAIPLLRQAVDKAPGVAVFRYHLGMALLAGGQPRQAREQLVLAASTRETFPGLEEARAALSRL